jgi:pimeloyl-ACP methyl ester carboxylesterase
MERAAPGVLHADLAACNAYGAPLERAAAVRCPVLLLLGKQDLLTPPRAAIELEAGLADVRKVVLDCGHMLTAERPDQVLDALRRFLL